MRTADNPAQEIFFKSLDCDSPEQLADFLDKACASDTVLRERVEKLLQAHSRAGEFLGGCTRAERANLTEESKSVGTLVGQYKLLEVIGEGGMGTVYMAEQTEPVHRRVALKLIKAGMDTRQVVARFEAERQALAMMEHPNIAKVLEAGSTDSGRPFFVMELVKGKPITKFCDEQRLDLDSRMKLFQQVCQAVQHAHQKGIIHRDIKPSNVLVAMYDDQPVPKVIDFGVAKATGDELTEKTMFTRFGQIVGTLEYMSPEQAQFNQLDIDTRSDIYSLGAILYELLTGEPPFEREKIRNQPLDETLRMIREEEPTKPSTKFGGTDRSAQVASNRKTSPEKLGSFLRGDLDWIVMKALEKERSRRYETAYGLSLDIDRYLNDETVSVSPPSAVYRFRKFASRHKVGLAFASVIGIFVVAGLIGLSISNYLLAAKEKETLAALKQADENHQAALQSLEREAAANKKTKAINDFVIKRIVDLANPLKDGGSRDVAVRDALITAANQIDDSFKEDVVLGADVKSNLGKYLRSIGEYEAAQTCLEDATAVLEQEFGPDDARVLENKLALVKVYRELGELDLALATGREVHDMNAATKGEEHRDTVAALFHIGAVYSKQRQIQEAHSTLQKVLDASQDKMPDLHALAIMELGNLSFYQQKNEDAKSYWLDALSRFSEATGGVNILYTKSNLSKVYWQLGARAESLELTEEVAAEMDRVLGPLHPISLSARQDLATRRFYNNDKRAFDQFKLLLERSRSKYGPRHERTAKAMTDLGTALRGDDQLQEALQLHQAALEIVVERYGKTHPKTIYTLGTLAQSQRAAGKYELAAQSFQDAIEARLTIASEKPDDTANQISLGGLYCNYGNLLRDQLNQFEKSLAALNKAIGILAPIKSIRGKRFLTNSYSSRAKTLAEQNQLTEALTNMDLAIANATSTGRNIGMRLLKARLLARSGRVNESVALIDEIVNGEPKASDLYFAARVLALCALNSQQDDEPSQPDLLDANAKRSINLLQRAHALDPDEAKKLVAAIRNEPDFDAIRQLADFQTFHDQIATAEQESQGNNSTTDNGQQP